MSGNRTGTGTSTRTMGTINVNPVPVQVQCERSYIKPYNPFIHVSVAAPVPVLETASVIKTISAVSTTNQTFLVTTHPPVKSYIFQYTIRKIFHGALFILQERKSTKMHTIFSLSGTLMNMNHKGDLPSSSIVRRGTAA